jgi:predicted nucleotidyltransferase
MSREELFAQVRAVLQHRPEVLEAYVFGSVARGDGRPHSDLDVAVYVDPSSPTPAFGHAAELGAELMRALGRSDVDLVVLNQATPLLYHRVLRDGERVLSRDLRKTTTREGYALSRECDDVVRRSRVDAIVAARQAQGRFGR